MQMTEEQRDELIAGDNERKEYCLMELAKMCYHLDIGVVRISATYGEDNAMETVNVEFANGGVNSVFVREMDPLTMVWKVIKKAHLG